MTWCKHLLNGHGRYLKDHSSSFMTLFRSLQKHVTYQHTALQRVSEETVYALAYLQSILARAPEDAIDLSAV